jgi:arginyl-tRNA synthetase
MAASCARPRNGASRPHGGRKGNLDAAAHPAELALLRKMAELPEVIERPRSQLAPHNLAFYAQDLGAVFHTFYENCRVVSSEPADAG